ncbi:hypothetical protein [Actinomadura monticuli]|uniref:Uncharacterized protein n=1 Tax=Actinomadura monticuli TaxID=3097367 RepID=A0ABV4Q410_9ACTN
MAREFAGLPSPLVGRAGAGGAPGTRYLPDARPRAAGLIDARVRGR